MNSESRPPQLWLEQLALGELPADRERDLRSRFGEAQIEAWLAALKADSEQALQELPAEQLGDQVRARMLLVDVAESPAPGHASRVEKSSPKSSLKWTRPRFQVWSLAMAGLALFVLGAVALRMQVEPAPPVAGTSSPVPSQREQDAPTASATESAAQEEATQSPRPANESHPAASPREERLALAQPHLEEGQTSETGVRIKSDALQLLAFLLVGSEIKPVHTGDTVCGGQFLQLHYLTTEPGYGMVISIDGSGNRVQHLPAGASDGNPSQTGNTQAAALQLGSVIPLPHSYELDQAPHFERFFFFMAEKPFALSDIEPALKRYQGGIADPKHWKAKLRGLPARVHATSLTLTKGCQP
jgi:hypothetical protein